ncbi:hypothetical protein J2793_004693 [Paraburkholderia caledonica]|uniref:Uncharacterized protein n=1 Tax=Paraburkholderia caledonica TaxID=134536 RepID=A0AB73IIM1_9BURK|nr:hypothetical protein [Paraburkholderia caledonica]
MHDRRSSRNPRDRFLRTAATHVDRTHLPADLRLAGALSVSATPSFCRCSFA